MHELPFSSTRVVTCMSGQDPSDGGKTGGNAMLRVEFLNIQKTLRNKVRLRGVTILESGGATT